MAAIVKRNNKYSVVYQYSDGDGNKKQKWESCKSYAEAKKRKAQVEYEQQNGNFVIPTATTVKEFLDEYISIYGVNKWALSTYTSNCGLIQNYINPYIGDIKLEKLNPRMMDYYFQNLLKVKIKQGRYRKPKNKYLTAHIIREIHKLLRSAFNQAVKWELMSRNPVINATLPKEEHETREIWTAETLRKALEVCDNEILALAINLSFSCSLRMGEMLGLTWDCVDISEESLKENAASIYVNKELQRVNRETMERLNNKDVIFTFPKTSMKNVTALVLKAPKTKTSIRKVFLPNTVAQMLIKRKEQIDELKDLLGDEYHDYNLVFAHSMGRPMEGKVILDALKKLIREHDLPDVVFHSFRHASITYKLKWNGGDMKAVQGDSGHARMEMVAEVYSHIIDEDRRINAQRFEEQFYQEKALKNKKGKPVPIPKFAASSDKPNPIEISNHEPDIETKNTNSEVGAEGWIKKIMENPEAVALLKTIAQSL